MEQFIMKTKIYMGEAWLILYVTRLWKNQERLQR